MSCTCALLSPERAYFGDGGGRVYANLLGSNVDVLHTHGAAIQCLLEADLVVCGRPGLVVGDARGKITYFFDGQVLLTHALPFAITSLALHHTRGHPTVAAAAAGGAVVLFGADAIVWRLRLQDAGPLRACAPFASALASVVSIGDHGSRRNLVAATGGSALATLGAGGAVSVWHAPEAVSALGTFEGDEWEEEGADRRLLVAAGVQLFAADGAASAADTCTLFCHTGVHVIQVQALLHHGGLLVACCGHFDGVLLASRHGILRHVLPPDSMCDWPLAVRLQSTAGTDQTNLPRSKVHEVYITIAISDGQVATLSTPLEGLASSSLAPR